MSTNEITTTDTKRVVVRESPLVGTMLASYSALPSVEGSLAVWTYPLITQDDRIALHRMITTPSPSLWDLTADGPIQFACFGLAAHFGEHESEDRPGELIQGPILTLIGPKVCYHTGSKYVFRSLQQLASLLGPAPWDPPVILEARRYTSRNRRVYQSISCVDREV